MAMIVHALPESLFHSFISLMVSMLGGLPTTVSRHKYKKQYEYSFAVLVVSSVIPFSWLFFSKYV